MPRKYIKGSPAVRFWAYVERGADCWEWTGARDRLGYGQFKHGPATSLAHRFAYELTYGPIPAGQVVCHRCDNPSCVRPDHLWLGTPLDNERDKIAKGRKHSQRGARNSHAKLTAQDVTAIRAAHDAGATMEALASAYGVTVGTIRDIVTFRSWRHLDPERAAKFRPKRGESEKTRPFWP